MIAEDFYIRVLATWARTCIRQFGVVLPINYVALCDDGMIELGHESDSILFTHNGHSVMKFVITYGYREIIENVARILN